MSEQSETTTTSEDVSEAFACSLNVVERLLDRHAIVIHDDEEGPIEDPNEPRFVAHLKLGEAFVTIGTGRIAQELSLNDLLEMAAVSLDRRALSQGVSRASSAR